jgi:hypothetical protein
MYTSLVIENLSEINEGATGHKGYIGEYMKYIEMVINYVGWRIYEQN